MSRCAFFKFFLLFGLGSVTSGCAFLPGFGILEDPILYYLDVSEVANQVACELQEFMWEQQNDQNSRSRRWLLDDDDVPVKLTLSTDNQGNVNFTGIDAAKLGFEAIADLITKQSSVPSLGAKLSAKRSRTVQIAFAVSPKPLSAQKLTKANLNDPSDFPQTVNCRSYRDRANPATALYLKQWLKNYFYTVNYKEKAEEPEQFKMQSINLTTAILIGVDLSAGATPRVLGNGNVFILPVHGMNLGFSPSYSHKIDMTLRVCDNSFEKHSKFRPCLDTPYETTLTAKLREQCKLYSKLVGILKDVTSPKDVMQNGKHLRCDKSDGEYREAKKSS